MNEMVDWFGWLENHLDKNEDWTDFEQDIINNADYLKITIKEEKILRYRFIDRLTYREIGEKFNVKRNRIRVILLSVSWKINKKIKSNHLHFLNETRKKLNQLEFK